MSVGLKQVISSLSSPCHRIQSLYTFSELPADLAVHDLVEESSMEDGPGRGASGQKTMATPARRSLPEPESPRENGRNSAPSQLEDVMWNDVSELRDTCLAELQFTLLVLLFASAGFLAVTLVILLWLKSQMLLSKKQKDCEEPESESDTSDCTDIGERVKPASPSTGTLANDGNDSWAHDSVMTQAQDETSSANVEPQALENVEALLPEALRQSVVVAGPSCGEASCSMGTVVSEGQSAVRLASESRPEPLRPKSKGLLERRGSSASLTIDLLHPSQENISTLTAPTRECTTEEYLLSASHVLSRKQLRGCLRDVNALHREFWDIPSNYAEQVEVAGSGTKNRYRTILPNEHTRVRIVPSNTSAEPGSAEDQLACYINANYIKGYEGEERAYIATQGPLNHTVQDFWLMVWGEHVPAIVMITKLMEKGKVKCEPYIPLDQPFGEDRADASPDSPYLLTQGFLGGPGASATYGDITVTVQKVSPRDGYVVRELHVTRGDETRIVHHYWYDTWPDHKTPPTAHGIVELVREVESERQRTLAQLKRTYGQDAPTHAPVVVHCSAGIGRTGCFIAVAIGICQLAEENSVDVLGIVCRLRHDRGGMVQTAEQYEFIHRALCLFEKSLPDQSGE